MAKNKNVVVADESNAAPAVKERKPRKDGRPHPPEGMRYNKKGELVASIPPEMRGYYVVMGLSRRTGQPQIVCRFKSSKAAQRYCDGSGNLLREAYSAVNVVRCKLFSVVFDGGN
jgi:hypothetical protein